MRNRPELEKVIDALPTKGVLVLAEWHRVNGSLVDGIAIMQRVHKRGAYNKVLDRPGLDLTTPSDRGTLALLPGLAEEERTHNLRRANEGRIAAIKRGSKRSTRLAMVLLIGLLSPSPSTAQQCDGVELAIATNERRCLRPGGGERFKDCANCPEMVVVPAGAFVMGSPPTELEREVDRENQVLVTIAKPFAIGAFAVTRGEFAAFVAATNYALDQGCYFWTGTTWEERSDRSWRFPGFPQDDRHPVTCVDLKAAKAYASWVSGKTGKRYRLPSETEREYVSRAGTDTPFWSGYSISTDAANYNGTISSVLGPSGEWRQMTVRVDSFRPNPWGLYNVHGNVWDWTDDCWNESNAGNPRDGSARTTGDCAWRVARGGAWNYGPTYLRSAYRYWNLPHNRSGVQSFRIARSL
jgi:formylglycine-generating enzyme required for sulfatase activity